MVSPSGRFGDVLGRKWPRYAHAVYSHSFLNRLFPSYVLGSTSPTDSNPGPSFIRTTLGPDLDIRLRYDFWMSCAASCIMGRSAQYTMTCTRYSRNRAHPSFCIEWTGSANPSTERDHFHLS